MDKNKIIILVLIVVIAALLVGMVATMSNMNKKNTKLTFKSNATLTEGASLKIKLTDDNGTALANQTVNVTIINKDKSKDYHSVETNKNGIGTLKLDKKPGKYNVTITYAGNDNFTGCNATKKIKIEEKVAQSEPVAESSQAQSTTSNDDNYYNGYSRSSFSEGEQAAIDEARANGYDSPADYYKATGKSAGQDYMDAHPEWNDRR